MIRRLPLAAFCFVLTAAPLLAQDDMQDKIRLLELQIQELKAAQARQAAGKVKTDQCLRAFGRDKFCACLGQNLPATVSFGQYVQTMIATKEELGYSAMKPEQKKTVDDTLDTAEKCIEKGLFR